MVLSQLLKKKKRSQVTQECPLLLERAYIRSKRGGASRGQLISPSSKHGFGCQSFQIRMSIGQSSRFLKRVGGGHMTRRISER